MNELLKELYELHKNDQHYILELKKLEKKLKAYDRFRKIIQNTIWTDDAVTKNIKLKFKDIHDFEMFKELLLYPGEYLIK